ncbi:MAG: hypothetical protein LPK21_15630 [Hymenobacteraceae bacterium]|nr:hypothetical protein [Hymenobacteraceae bacterium]
MNLRKLILFIKKATIVVLALLGAFHLGIYLYNLFQPASESVANTNFLVMGLIYLAGAFLLSRFRIR